MGRAAILAGLLLAAPAATSAQATGTIVLGDGWSSENYLNAAGCAGAVDVRWNARPINGFTEFPAGGIYTLYASNQAPEDFTCFKGNDAATGLQAFAIGVVLATGLVADATWSGDELVNGNGGNVVADCSSMADQTIYLCVEGTMGGPPTFGFATAAIVVSTARPPPPHLTSVTPADGALDVAWEPGTATSSEPAAAAQYVLEAFPTGPADPVLDHEYAPTAATSYRLAGLVNGVVYSVQAVAISRAGNESAPSFALTAAPAAVRETPWAAQGSASGGCAAGLAGPLGLAVVLATLALRPGRRRR